MARGARTFDVSVLGDKALTRKLRALPYKMQGKAVRPAMRAAAKLALAPIKSQAPRRTGKLAAGLKLRATKGRRGRVGVGIHTPPRDKLGIDPSDPYYYPAAVELGTDKLAGSAFMRGPFKALRDRMLRKMRVEIWRNLRKLAGESA